MSAVISHLLIADRVVEADQLRRAGQPDPDERLPQQRMARPTRLKRHKAVASVVR